MIQCCLKSLSPHHTQQAACQCRRVARWWCCEQIPKEWREQLRARGVRSGRSIEHSRVASPDGTVKFLLQVLPDICVGAVILNMSM